MATIIKHKVSNKTFVLLGTGFGAFHSEKPNWFFGDLVADQKSGQFAMVCVTNETGRIGWLDSSECQVISIDGKNISSIFSTKEYSA